MSKIPDHRETSQFEVYVINIPAKNAIIVEYLENSTHSNFIDLNSRNRM